MVRDVAYWHFSDVPSGLTMSIHWGEADVQHVALHVCV